MLGCPGADKQTNTDIKKIEEKTTPVIPKGKVTPVQEVPGTPGKGAQGTPEQGAKGTPGQGTPVQGAKGTPEQGTPKVKVPTKAEKEEATDKLFKAVKAGNSSQVTEAITEGANIEARDNDGGTALMWATHGGHTAIVKALIDKGADIDAKDTNGDTALMNAAFVGHKAIVEALLDKGADVTAKNKKGWTALKWATRAPHPTAIVELLEDTATDKLFTAVKANDARKATEALDAGARVNAKDTAGWTALMWGAWNGHEGTVKALIDDGANLNALSKADSSALKLATVKGHTAIVTRLGNAGATGTPTAPTKDEKEEAGTKLLRAAASGNVDQVNEALEAGADVNGRDYDTWKPLTSAILYGRTDTVKVLIEKGADVNSKALKLANDKGYKEIAALLQAAGATR